MWLSVNSSAFLLALTGALMPGPMMTVTAQHALRSDAAGPAVVAGHAVLEAAVVAAVALGAALSRTCLCRRCRPHWRSSSRLHGIGVVRTAGTALNADGGSNRITQPDLSKRALLSAGISGTVTSISNPYWVIWWGTVGAGHLALALHFRRGRCGGVFRRSFLGRSSVVHSAGSVDGHRREAAPSGGLGDDLESAWRVHGGDGRLLHLLRSRIPHRQLVA